MKAIASGHRAATAVREYLDAEPLTGRWAPSSRAVRVPRGDIPADWEERLPAGEEELPVEERIRSFVEVHLPLPVETAMAEAARCMRCDAETKSYSYNRRAREEIYHLARDIKADEQAGLAFLRQKLSGAAKSLPAHRATLEDLVFLPANLTRLVIDPYRENCATRTVIGARAAQPLRLSGPVLVGGLPAGLAPDVLDAIARGAGAAKIAVRLPISSALPTVVPVIGVVPLESVPTALPALAAIELAAAPATLLSSERLLPAVRAYRALGPTVPIGLSVPVTQVEAGLAAALAAGLDFVTLSAMSSSDEGHDGWRDDRGYPEISVLARALEYLRAVNREEDIDLLYFGGIRNGADVARVLALGANAALLGFAACLAVGLGEQELPRRSAWSASSMRSTWKR